MERRGPGRKGAVIIEQTIIEKILSEHSGRSVGAGEVTWIDIDVRSARDFGGANVVKNLKIHYEPPYVEDPGKTYFTFDCNVPARDTGYAENQEICRVFARETGVRVFDIRAGIGSHVLMERGIARPGSIVVGTDSHLNIMGAVGCFGQGMGDRDIAYVFATGRNWFEVPSTIRFLLEGSFEYPVTAKDVTLAVIERLGSAGALGKVIEFTGALDLSLSGKITLASMATEMGAVAAFLPIDEGTLGWLRARSGDGTIEPVTADAGASYTETLELDLSSVEPMAACPFSPSNVQKVSEIAGTRIDTAFLGSCTNGRFEDMVQAASILKGRRVSEGVTLKVVPATQEVFERMLGEGLLHIFMQAGALVSNPGCSGCASGQIGMIGRGEVQLSTSNRNFAGKQGKGETYLVSPATLAASVIEGKITSPAELGPVLIDYTPDERSGTMPEISLISWRQENVRHGSGAKVRPRGGRPESGGGSRRGLVRGKARLIATADGRLMDDIDTDMIFHNKYLSITDIDEMGPHTFETLAGYDDFASGVQPGDVILAGTNFGCGSSRQQAVDCFISLGVSIILTESTGAIYKRNIINSGFAFLEIPGLEEAGIEEEEELEIDFERGTVRRAGGSIVNASHPTDVQLDIWREGGLFAYTGEE